MEWPLLGRKLGSSSWGRLGSLLCPGSPRRGDSAGLRDGIWNSTPGSGFKMSQAQHGHDLGEEPWCFVSVGQK